MGETLVSAGIPFEPHFKHFVHNAPDEDWLRFAGSRGWPVLARDKNFRYKPNEYAAYIDAKVLGFIFTAGNLTGAETARLALVAHPMIVKLAATVHRPAIFSIDREGTIRPLRLRTPAGP